MARTPNSLRPRASSTTTLADPSSNVGHAPYAISRAAKITLSEGTTPRRLSGASSSERAIAQLRRLARHRPSRVLLLAATVTLGAASAEARAFETKAELQADIDLCLAAVPSGLGCCAMAAENCPTANDGGTTEMPDWDVSKVTNMNSMFNGAAAFAQQIGG